MNTSEVGVPFYMVTEWTYDGAEFFDNWGEAKKCQEAAGKDRNGYWIKYISMYLLKSVYTAEDPLNLL